MEEELGLTVGELFRMSHFKEAVILGGREGLDRLISRINVMEVPDVIDWVRPGEFLVTTGYPFRNRVEMIAPLIAQLAERGVVALGVKTTRFIGEVPAEAIEAANRHGLPLIELPADMAFSDVVRSVMERVLVAESRHLSMLQGRVQRLSQVLLHGGGLAAFLEHLELLVRNPVLLLEPSGRWSASPAAESLCQQVETEEWDKLRRERTLETGFIRVGDTYVRTHATEIEDARGQSFLLVMLEVQQEYGIVDTLTMNWASELVGFEINNAQARSRIEAKYIDQFVQDWLAGRIISPVDLRLRAEACGSPLADDSVYVAGIVRFKSTRPTIGQLQELARRLNWDAAGQTGEPLARWTILEEELTVLFAISSQEGTTASAAQPGDLPVARESAGQLGPDAGTGEGASGRLVVSTTSTTSTSTASHMAERLLQVAAAQLARLEQLFPDRAVQLCLGRQAAGQSEVPVSCREAKRAVEVATVCGMTEPVVHYGELGVYLLLYRLQGTLELEEFKRTYLEPLLRYDAKHQGSLLHTLRVYFQCNGNARETADQLFIHYNTVTYRLDRIRTELGLRLDDPETRLQLQLAVKLVDIKDG
ncbi:PucR family transcriptional regulator [Paenibacillus daejeonensis]|uniref:PucR family transcriptional regulator n=1 Tax=Paenibacillus daejeonensis TaxID=135193 RepID=UPI000380F98A|nr:PucR family transcriptional regulator [Paenibacillus daejeonensis]